MNALPLEAEGKPAATHKVIRSNKSAWQKIKRHWQFYLLVLIPVANLIIFKYIPMFGVVMAFKEYNVLKGIWGSPWVGMKYFDLFFHNPYFTQLLKNTLGLSIYHLIIGFPGPILLALALNEIKNGLFKRTVQLVTYAPYFISTVIMVSIIMMVLSPTTGILKSLMGELGYQIPNMLGMPAYFKSIYVWSDLWQNIGYGAIIYLAALAGVDPHLYEAARVDGASRLQKILNIDIPGILPTATILLILNVGGIMQVGFEKVYLLQNPLNTSSSEVISTYVYKIGLLDANFSFGAAVGLFNSVVNLILLVAVNFIAKRISQNSLW
ncbi:sugar ABC transporter permease [Paenibacillus sp. CCS19]|uniref:ABC transporter permease n=1 Tax=Paenibacillus sp. CCS19 TaxID=3158387 RepID=UPI00256BF21A|nr:ABC transporter permease subunit [Paenibacillus cellulosilyticus]GMK38614.1 sugar ABC transporter permease [Paenibacillus cellulosilyticus]